MLDKNKYTIQLSIIICLGVLFLVCVYFLNNKNNPLKLEATNIETFCKGNIEKYGGKENCYANQFKDLGSKKGPEYGFKVLDELQKIDSDSIGCHLIAHGLGLGSYERDPDNWRLLVQNMRTTCNYGAIHGVVEGYVDSLPTKSLSKEVIPTICGDNPRADCNHIVGHLLLVETDANVSKALDLCELFKDKKQNEFCITGVFMEYQTALNLIQHGLVPKSWLNWSDRLDGLEKMCRIFSGNRAVGCWKEIVHVALVKFKNDPKKIFEFCDTAQVLDGAKECKRHSIGIMGASKNFDLMQLKNICSVPQKNDPNFEAECYPDLVSSSLSTIPDSVKSAVLFCDSLDDKFKKPCFSMIGAVQNYSGYDKNKLSRDCRVVSAEYRDYCEGKVSFNSSSYQKND